MTLRVLYVDDDRINSLLFEEICRVAGVSALELAGTGAEALELAPRFQPDLLVIDLHLPDTDGLRLLGALRQALGNPRLPAFLCSADASDDLPARAVLAGFDGCWSKPVALNVVRDECARRLKPAESGPHP